MTHINGTWNSHSKPKILKKNKSYTFDSKEAAHSITQERVKKETAIINNPNKILDEVVDKVQPIHKSAQSQRYEKITEDHNAIVENEQSIKKRSANKLQKIDFKEIEKALEKQIIELENKTINR